MAFRLKLDRSAKTSLSEQIRVGVEAAIQKGLLRPEARLPSWRDLAAQLGVARGTVRVAYERLQDAQLIVASKSQGTRVAARPAQRAPVKPSQRDVDVPAAYRELASGGAGIFQMGVPAMDVFPVALMARLRAQSAREEVASSGSYPDPRGEHMLRREIAAHLALARGIECQPTQVMITAGFSGALGLALHVLRARKRVACMEDPGFPLTRRALGLAQWKVVPVPVDDQGIDVAYAVERNASLVVVTPGQQAPLGPTLALERRLRLLAWAAQRDAWILEDDYLGELQLRGRAAPALMSLDRAGRVVHIGSFSKTLSPSLRLGFLVVPMPLVQAFEDGAACLAPAPGPAVQRAVAELLRDGHYLRHLRRMKRIYAARRDALLDALAQHHLQATPAGLAVHLRLAPGTHDVRIAREALAFGLAPAPLSPWYATAARPGLLLGVATSPENAIKPASARLKQLIEAPPSTLERR